MRVSHRNKATSWVSTNACAPTAPFVSDRPDVALLMPLVAAGRVADADVGVAVVLAELVTVTDEAGRTW